jgi:hypothetical protein
MEKGSDEEQQSVADAHSSPETSLSQDPSKVSVSRVGRRFYHPDLSDTELHGCENQI